MGPRVKISFFIADSPFKAPYSEMYHLLKFETEEHLLPAEQFSHCWMALQSKISGSLAMYCWQPI
jgi:hypothetical protein